MKFEGNIYCVTETLCFRRKNYIKPNFDTNKTPQLYYTNDYIDGIVISTMAWTVLVPFWCKNFNTFY